MSRFLALLLCVVCPLLVSPAAAAPPGRSLKVLFLGDRGHHQPEARFNQLEPVLARRGISLTYTEKVDDLNADTLAGYDGLIVYANIDTITASQEASLVKFVFDGRGFIPLHCASYCFRNSPVYVRLVGAQFQRHGTGVFRTTIAEPSHPITKGFGGFESWDETYVHTQHNEKDRIVLDYREDPRDGKEPWTWVRTHGKGRVFYTAWGHDERTWGHVGFQNLIERGVRWACGDDPSVVPSYAVAPEMTVLRTDVAPFEYVDAKVPFYPAGKQWGTIGEPITKMQKPLSPEESLKHFVTPVGFEVKLFASEPDLKGKPICMNWDERGRLWVCETVDYPNEQRSEGQGCDSIRICEDTDGDGRADKFTQFADKLSIPTSLAFSRGGVVVHQAPHTLFLRDTNGDDVADERRVLFTGWSTYDTHAGPSNIQYGFDNWFYSMVGYAGFQGTVGGERHSFKQGFFRFKPDGSKIEFLRNTNNNSWGVGFSEEGHLFGSTANGCPSVYLPIPNRYYESVRGWSSSVLENIADNARYYPITDKVRQVDHHGNFTAATGHALYTARTYPKEYWNRTAFVTGCDGHLVATFELYPQGADFRSHNSWNLLASDDEWCAPTMAEVGPDGHVWVADWYNYIVQHNPTPAGYKTGKGNAYETDLRDKTHGRIYRVVYTSAKDEPRMTLKDATPEMLVEALKHPNLLWRRHAQRLLVERGKKDVLAALLNLAQDQSLDEIGLNVGAIHALWTLKGLGALVEGTTFEGVKTALVHPSAGVRRAAVQVLPRSDLRLLFGEDAAMDKEKDAQVRLAAFLAVADGPSNTGPFTARWFWQHQGDAEHLLLDACTVAAARHDYTILYGAQNFPTQYMPKVLERVAEHFARREPSRDEVLAVLRDLTQFQSDALDEMLTGLERGWPRNRTVELTPAVELGFAQVVTRVPPKVQGKLATFATQIGSKALDKYSSEIAAGFLVQVESDKATDDVRIAAAAQFIDFRKSDVKAAKSLLEVITPRTSPELTRGLLEAVGRSEAKEVGETLLERVGTLTPSARPIVWRALLGRSDWTQSLLDALEAGTVQPADLALDQKQALAAHPDKQVAERASKLLSMIGALPSPDRQKVYEELLPLTKKTGDAKLGFEVYKKHCSKCHIHGSEGTRIGPDLTGVAVHPKAELLTNIVDPSRSVEGNFRMYNVATVSGRVVNGLLLSESKTAIELADVEGKKQTILREDIDELIASTKSLMPEGFEKSVKPEELTDLLEFLAARGKYLPIPLTKAATIVTTKGMFWNEDGEVERLVFPDWSPKTFDGVPFVLIDPQGGRIPNAIMLHGPQGRIAPTMPKSASVVCNAPAKTIHMLSGVSGWGFPASRTGTVSMTVRLHYADGKTEDHALKNGEHFADYIRRVDVPGSKFAFALRGQQIRYIAVTPGRKETIAKIEFVKGPDATAPVVMAVTVEAPD